MPDRSPTTAIETADHPPHDTLATADHPALLDAFCQMQRTKRQLEDRLKSLKAAIELADDRLREEYFEAQGLESVRTGGGTVSVRRELYVSPLADRAEVAARLRRSRHFGDLVAPNYNTQTLNAAVRERIREKEEELGDALLGLSAEERRTALLRAALGTRLAALFRLSERQRLTFSSKS